VRIYDAQLISDFDFSIISRWLFYGKPI